MVRQEGGNDHWFLIPDQDECELGTAGCHSDADCFNTQGTSICRCKQGRSNPPKKDWNLKSLHFQAP